MSTANIWRTQFQEKSETINEGGVEVTDVETEISQLLLEDLRNVPPSREEFASLKDKIVKSVPEFNVGGEPVSRLMIENVANPRKRVLERLEILNPDTYGPERNNQDFLKKARVDHSSYKKVLAVELYSLVCSRSKDGSPNKHALFILRGLRR